jgi:hypothetical protein
MASQISRYEEMNVLSTRMVEAARSQDWASLASLERSVAALREALIDDHNALAESELERKRQEAADRAPLRRLRVNSVARAGTQPRS